VDPATGGIIPTDGRHRKANTEKGGKKNEDYKKLYETVQKRCEKLESLVAALQKEIKELRR